MLSQKNKIYAIPGWGFQSSVLRTLSNKNFHMIGLDYMHLSQLTLKEMSKNLSASIPEESVLLGWSFGGLIAIQMAASFPSKVKKLILLNSQPKLLASLQWAGIDPLAAKIFHIAFKEDFKKCMNKFVSLIGHPNPSFAIRQALRQKVCQTSPQALASFLSELFGADLRDEYRHLRCDVLHIISDQDKIIRQDIIHLLALNPRICTKIFINTSHAGFLSNRALYIDAIEGFLYHE
jgi:pimeloyl-[acyl-carrier protein] methyl ester esterase